MSPAADGTKLLLCLSWARAQASKDYSCHEQSHLEESES